MGLVFLVKGVHDNHEKYNKLICTINAVINITHDKITVKIMAFHETVYGTLVLDQPMALDCVK